MKKYLVLISCIICITIVLCSCGVNEDETKNDTNPNFNSNSTTESNQYLEKEEVDSEYVNLVLNREIFILKDDLPEWYNTTIKDFDKCKAYTNNWKFKEVINEDNYTDISWEKKMEKGGLISLNFKGTNILGEKKPTVEIQFIIQEDGKSFFASTLNIIDDEKTLTSISMDDFLGNQNEYPGEEYISIAMAATDAAIGEMLVLMSDGGTDVDYTEGYSSINELYDKKITEYKDALTMGIDKFYTYVNDDCSSINYYAINNEYNYGGSFYYGFYDVDGNGSDELLFKLVTGGGDVGIVDIYTINNGKIDKLFKHASFGERETMYVLSNGIIMTEGASSAFEASCNLWYMNSNSGQLELSSGYFYLDSNMDGDTTFYDGHGYARLDENEYRNNVQLLKEDRKSVV